MSLDPAKMTDPVGDLKLADLLSDPVQIAVAAEMELDVRIQGPVDFSDDLQKVEGSLALLQAAEHGDVPGGEAVAVFLWRSDGVVQALDLGEGGDFLIDGDQQPAQHQIDIRLAQDTADLLLLSGAGIPVEIQKFCAVVVQDHLAAVPLCQAQDHGLPGEAAPFGNVDVDGLESARAEHPPECDQGF